MVTVGVDSNLDVYDGLRRKLLKQGDKVTLKFSDGTGTTIELIYVSSGRVDDKTETSKKPYSE